MKDWAVSILMAFLAVMCKAMEIVLWTFFLGSALVISLLVLWS